MTTRFPINWKHRGIDGKRIIGPNEYAALEQHLKSGKSFWSSPPAMGMGTNLLERLFREDIRIKDLRFKYDEKYREKVKKNASTNSGPGFLFHPSCKA